MAAQRLRALCIAGPTAAGKTAAALAVAGEHAVEIISVDSALVYRGMDIGTAKPSDAERSAVPHHLIDILDPLQAYSAAAFARDATRLIDEIRARGRLPLLVGGTMLYFKALREGLDSMPAADAGVRAALDARARLEGWPALHDELRRIDPDTAARLPPGDAQRIQRALEVWHLSGRPLSDWQRGATRAPVQDLPLISLEPDSRAWLHQRIAQRFEQMLDSGFVDEVHRLRERGDLDPQLPSMRCVGYRQAWELLAAGPLDERGWLALRERGIIATRQLAKRQLTWLRSTCPRTVIACDRADAVPALLRAIRQTLALASGPG